MSFNSKQHAAIMRWIDQAVPLRGVYFRSVEYRYMDPADVLSGAGTRTHGGRFAAVSHLLSMSEPGADVWEKWRAIVSEQIASGQSVAAFCKERGVTSSQLFAWKKRLREAEKAQFVEVQVRPAEPLLDVVNRQQARAIEVKLCRGRSIVVEPGFDADHLRALLAVLEPEA